MHIEDEARDNADDRSPPEGEPTQASAGTPGEDPEALRDRWLRAEAELQNFRRRAQKDVEEMRRFSEERLLLELISLLDDLERAVALAREAGAADPWVQGVQLVAQRMNDVLSRSGVTPVDPLGQAFDPSFQEALLEVDATNDVEPGHVVQVVRKGYARDGRALRAARVVVARSRVAGNA